MPEPPVLNLTSAGQVLWWAFTLAPLALGGVLRWPHAIVPMWRRPGALRRRVAALLLACGAWVSPPVQSALGWARASLAFRDLDALRGASVEAFTRRTGHELAPRVEHDLGRTWLAPLSPWIVDVRTFSGTHVDCITVRRD